MYMKEMAIAMLPIVGIFLLFQLCAVPHEHAAASARSSWVSLYTYVGLVLFLTGVNVGFSNSGRGAGRSTGRAALWSGC